MRVAQSLGAVCVGAAGQLVAVQVHIAAGLPRTTIVGLADTAVSEARDRVRSALINSGFTWPDQRITISLSPASQHKRGSGLDFAIAVAVLAADGHLALKHLTNSAFVGELGLDGSIRPVSGAVAMALELARQSQGARVFVPGNECDRWALVHDIRPVPVGSLAEAAEMLKGERPVAPRPNPPKICEASASADLADVRGQSFAGQAMEIAAAGGHHVLLTGPPGVGKTMLCQRLPGILPKLTLGQLTEVAAIQEVSSTVAVELSTRPPFQSPHHTASHVALVGGASGTHVRPGLVSLAHHGVLFLDEAPEFRRETLEALRQPLEEGHITIARSGVVARLPARFQLLLTQNPCPCGEADPPGGDCRCTSLARRRYESRLSGPLLDRVDLRIHLKDRVGDQACDSSEVARARVGEARARAAARLQDAGAYCNAAVPAAVIHKEWPWSVRIQRFLDSEQLRNRYSARSMDKTARVAWTIADLAGHAEPSLDDVVLALRLRNEI
jgi:magnesium chelatase family protein